MKLNLLSFSDLNSSLRAKDDRPTHIAFGTKVYKPSSSSGRKVSATGQREVNISYPSSRVRIDLVNLNKDVPLLVS